MLDVNDFKDLLYLSPDIAVYPTVAIIKSDKINELDKVLKTCEKERDLSSSVEVKNNYSYVKLIVKE